VRDAAPGDEQARFTVVVREHQTAVFGFVLRRVGDRGIAEDLSQEAFMRAWRGRALLRSESSERAWLLAIAANVVRDWARSRRRRPAEQSEAAFLDVPSSGEDPAERVAGAESIARLREALLRLPANHREMFLLRERDGLSYKEIAEIMRCPIGSVMSGLARARERLLEAMEG
jgi:RNA polymerase sigma-70 factor (ECF subfamily)